MHLATFFQWLNDLPFSVALREDDWPFPVIKSFHALGLGLSVGVIVWIDLRLIGVTLRLQPAFKVVSQLEPLAIRSFMVVFTTGDC